MLPPDDQPAAPTEGRSPFAEQLCVPQFGILHILILTAVMASLLKINLAFEAWIPSPSQSEADRWRRMIEESIFALALAANLVGAGVLIRAKCYRIFHRLQPGHWIVLFSAAAGLCLLVWKVVYYLVASDIRMIHWTMSLWGLSDLPIAIAFLYAARLLHDGRRWKVLLRAMALGHAAAAATAALSIVALAFQDVQIAGALLVATIVASTPWSVILLIMLVAAIVLDFRRWPSRDWMHWLGVVTLGLGYVVTIASGIAFVLQLLWGYIGST
jgi:hypothetical protein